MYQNKVTLIGFTGADAGVRTNDNRSLTTLSVATKSSYKKDGKCICCARSFVPVSLLV